MKDPTQSLPPSSIGFDLRSFSKDTLIYAMGQALVLLIGLVQILIVAKYLTMEDYGYWQLFMLYGSYVGILHLGFIDGVLVRWAGKTIQQISVEFRTAFQFLVLELVIIILPLALGFYLLSSASLQIIALLLLAHAFILGLFSFFRFTTQAIREFRLLTAIEVSRVVAFVLLVFLFFVFDCFDYRCIVAAFLASFLIASVALASRFRPYLQLRSAHMASLWTCGKINIGTGIFILLGNFMVLLFLTVDRLMVSSFFPIEEFAIYAFAIMIAVVMYTLVVAISQVLFPNLSTMSSELQIIAYRLGKPAIILAWATFLFLYFPVSRMVVHYLPQYLESLQIMEILLCSIGFSSIVLILHVNYYKVHRMQRQYFLWGVIALVLSIVLNLIAIELFETLESVAMATLISFAIWYLINELILKSVVEETQYGVWKYLLVICSYLGAFLLTSRVIDWFVAQILIYASFFVVVTWLFLRHQVGEIIAVVKGLFTSPVKT